MTFYDVTLFIIHYQNISIVLLQDHLKRVRAIHDRDLAEGWGRVLMPDAPDRKYPNAHKDWRWQRVFPQESRWKNPKTGEEGRHHVHQYIIQEAVAGAVRKSGLAKRANGQVCYKETI